MMICIAIVTRATIFYLHKIVEYNLRGLPLTNMQLLNILYILGSKVQKGQNQSNKQQIKNENLSGKQFTEPSAISMPT